MRNALLCAGLAIGLAHVGAIRSSARSPLHNQPAPDAQVVADFHVRAQRYVELHRTLEGPVPTVAISEDWTEVRTAIDALAARIRAARRDARRGDIFAPDIERWFRGRVAEYLEGCDAAELLATLNEENPEGLIFAPRVNGRWPDEASLGPMPPRLLAGLPPLPIELQYRFMNRDLILWDAHANIIVDYVKKAMP
jgi:hypothetical protein